MSDEAQTTDAFAASRACFAELVEFTDGALRTNGDFDHYWTFHQAQQRQRIHAARYADNVIPLAA